MALLLRPFHEETSMKRWMKLGLCVALGGLVDSVVVADDVFAQPKKPAPATVVAPSEPPLVRNAGGIELRPAGLRWGMTSAQLAEFYDREIDRRYKAQYDKAQPGPQTDRIDAAVANAKAAFRRSKIEFGNLPTGIDSGPLKGEYTYQNQESMMQYLQSSGNRYFFFIQDKLWKVYDEMPLGEKRPMGETYEDAAKHLATRYGVPGRIIEPDYLIGRNFTEIDWQDARTRVRLLDRSGLKIAAMVYEERATLANLAALRPNKPTDDTSVDPSIEALMRPPGPPPGPAVDDKKDTKKK